MSKINQIQKRLLELDGGSFQKLADAYLHKKGYERINPLGSLIGADKVRKGTPDTFVPLSNGKYVFAEYTTQQERVYEKIESDFDKCFHEEKTGVSIGRLEELVFCHTSTLTMEEESALADECRKRGVNLNVFGIGPLSYDLYQKYPGLARDFLGVDVDSGQILPPDEFVTTYNNSGLATPLDTGFHFREVEVERALQGLETNDLVIAFGRPGVGKSRFALECCKRFSQAHPDYQICCVYNRGPDLFEDLRVHFSEPGNYLILSDDSNRLNRFEYIVQLIQGQRDDQRIKVIVTVRDYAMDKTRETARVYGRGTEVELQPLEEDQIKQLVKDEYNIQNRLYLDRIADIAKGNPRLAIMAAELVNRDGTLQSINNVSVIYDEYFASIRRDLEDLGNPDLLKIGGILAFFRTVDRSNQKAMVAIQEAFGVTPEGFWEAARRLHDLEVLDMYENEVVRLSDQVLATYLFYLAFFKQRTVDFSILLERFFPDLRERLLDAINPALNAFDSQAIMNAMRPHVDKVWRAKEVERDEDGLLHLNDFFWFLKQTDTLLYVRERIHEMKEESVDLSKLEYKSDSNIPSPSVLSILRSFKHTEDTNFRLALDLLLDFLTKRRSKLPRILYLLTDHFGFTHRSYLRGFSVQRAVIDSLWKRTEEGINEFFAKLFLAVAEPYLHTRFHTSESRGGSLSCVH